MLTRHSEHMESALAGLSPDDRALLELSLLRGVSDEEIAGLLKVDTRRVQVRRDEALDSLIERLDGDAGRLDELLGHHDTAAAAREPRARRLATLGLVVLAAVVLAIVLAVSRGGGEEPRGGERQQQPTPPPKKAKPAPAPAPAAPAVALEPFGAASGARGSAGIAGGSLELRASGLPKGAYTVWLYDSVIDARAIGRFSGTSGDVDVKLPKGYERYESIDVSREPADGNPNHSGESLLRAPLVELKR
jgi:Anti-sigma-K factor rskA